MLKSISSIICLLFISVSCIFGSTTNSPPPNTQSSAHAVTPQQSQSPPRTDKLDAESPHAKILLQRAEQILSTLVFDPQSYHLILSNKACFGGEAVPPFVFSDKPSIILYQGSLSPNRSNEEIAFMMAHELGHLNLHHMEQMQMQMEKIFNGPPIGISGTTFAIFKVKLQEREADMFGLFLYKQAGYNIAFFPHTLNLIKFNPNLHYGSNRIFQHELSSLSMKDSHFSMKERFELLVSESKRAV